MELEKAGPTFTNSTFVFVPPNWTSFSARMKPGQSIS